MANPLGKQTEYPTHYAPNILHPIPRGVAREALSVKPDDLPFHGEDVWTAFELSWLNPKGKPCVALADIHIPCESPNMVESKSFKLYLNSLNQHVFQDMEELKACIEKDISNTVGSQARVNVYSVQTLEGQPLGHLEGECIDEADIEFTHYNPVPEALVTDAQVVTETLHSHLLKSNCRITSQPDWASVLIRYTGPKIDREGLLRYIVGFRQHDEFHEPCVEKIFVEIMQRCQCEKLTVMARYTRRGGLDINPFRSNFENTPPNIRMPRQ